MFNNVQTNIIENFEPVFINRIYFKDTSRLFDQYKVIPPREWKHQTIYLQFFRPLHS